MEQTTIHAYRESFLARRGSYLIHQLIAAAAYSNSIKKARGFTNELKQAPLKRKAKEGTEIPNLMEVLLILLIRNGMQQKERK